VIFQRLVRAFLIVEIEIDTETADQAGNTFVVLQVYVLVFYSSPEALDEYVVEHPRVILFIPTSQMDRNK